MRTSSPDGAHFNPQECLRIPEVADEWKVHVSTVYRLIQTRELRACKVASKLRVRRIEMRRYLDRTTGSDPAPAGAAARTARPPIDTTPGRAGEEAKRLTNQEPHQ